MKARLVQARYQLSTLLGIGVFVAACVWLDRVRLPLERRFGDPREPFDLRAQRHVHSTTRQLFRFYHRLGITTELHDTERLLRDGPHLVVANHPSLLDFVLLSTLMPQADCIVSSAWTGHFPLRGLADKTAYVRDDDPVELVRECAERLRKGRSVVIFPEGTRSPAHGLGPFRRSAARVALDVGCDLLPVILTWEPPLLYKGAGWGDLPRSPIHATVRVAEPIPLKPPDAEGGARVSRSVASRRVMADLREFFLEALELEGDNRDRGDVGDA